MKSIRRWIVLATLLTLLLSACGGTPAAQQPAAAPTTAPAAETTASEAPAPTEAVPATSGERTKIAFWYDPPEGNDADCFVETVIKSFNAKSTSVEIDAVAQPNAWDTTRTALAGGAGPDVIVTPGPSFAYELVKAGQLLALDEFVKLHNWSDRFVPWALSLGSVEGKVYSLPNAFETLILYYNKTLFEEKGWQPPKTVDEMVMLSATIKEAGIIPFGHANSEWRAANEWFVGEFMNHVAGPQKVYEALTGKRPWTDPDLVKAITILNDFQQQGYFNGALDRYYTGTFNDIHAALGKGEAAMNIEGTWFLEEIGTFFGTEAGNENDWGWVPVPSSTGDAIFSVGIGDTWSINAATKHPEAVAEFLDFFFSPAVQGENLALCSAAPAPIRLKSDALAKLDPRKAEIFEALGKASDANNYGYTTWTFWPPKSDVYIYEEIEKVWAKEKTPQEYMEGLQKLFDEEVKAGDIPPIPAR